MQIVVVGNAFDGMKAFGPFFTPEDATDFGDTCGADDWLVVDLAAPYRASLDALPGAEGDLPVGLFTGSIEAALNDECLVTLWPTGEVEVAFRSGLESWGPPTPLEARETR